MPAEDRPGTTAAGREYVGAVDHYTSPARRDAVKRHWEEPASRRMLDAAVEAVGPVDRLTVLDVGCGTGDGLALLRSAPAWQRRRAAGTALRYVGLDLDRRLLDVARRAHADDREVSFVEGDVRAGVPPLDTDLYLSSGVPYSHLTPPELEQALTDILHVARERARSTALVVDVLGRYSVEWTSRWGQRRWDYRMSFFRSETDPPSTPMSCYSGAELTALVVRAARRADCSLAGVEAFDRSVLVGRHTTTGDYTPGLPPYRELVNALYDPDELVDLRRLRFDVPVPAAPPEIEAYYASLRGAWNHLVETAVADAAGLDADRVASVRQPRLAEELCSLEAASHRGLGVGHSLTAVAVSLPAGRRR